MNSSGGSGGTGGWPSGPTPSRSKPKNESDLRRSYNTLVQMADSAKDGTFRWAVDYWKENLLDHLPQINSDQYATNLRSHLIYLMQNIDSQHSDRGGAYNLLADCLSATYTIIDSNTREYRDRSLALNLAVRYATAERAAGRAPNYEVIAAQYRVDPRDMQSLQSGVSLPSLPQAERPYQPYVDRDPDQRTVDTYDLPSSS
jgi:hypothetical protein